MNDRAARVRVDGPLAGCAGGFRAMLAERGYAPSSAAGLLQVMAHLSRWLERAGRSAGDLMPAMAEEFLLARRAAGYRRGLSARSIAPLLEYLREAGVAAAALPARPAMPGGIMLAGYRDYLTRERGLAASTVRNYLDVARLFAASCADGDGLRLDTLTAGEVIWFVLAQCQARSAGSATIVVTALRSLLRYLHLAGLIGPALAEAVPSAASASPLPEPLAPGQARRLLDSCDRRTVAGRRDFAVLVLLVRLGLRVSEVAALDLDDIDWRRGEITISGKGSRRDRLPLPADVGQAMAGWLRGTRPRCSSRRVFTTLLAPHGPMTGKAVSAVVRRAGQRAAVAPVTAHRLRHAAATGLLRAGASLPEVGQVLRHANMLSTARYARVDHAALAAVARPWPGGGR
jgi:integrase/recombinase XerD